MSDLERVVESIEENRTEIRGYGIEEIQVFGSLTKGEQSGSSYVDLLVRFEDGRGLFDDFVGLKRFLEDLLGRDVDLVKKEKLREELREDVLGGDLHAAEI